MPKEKPHLNLVIIGHIDHGKSTLMGHVLVMTGAVSDREAREMEQTAAELKDESFKFAFFMDRLAEERKRGITIDLAFRKFETANKYFTIIDAPGHADFVKNMITGASQADAAVLVISGKVGEAEAGISDGGQTREHAFLAKTLGVKQLIVAVNKMDDKSVNWAENRYNDVKELAKGLLTMVGYDVNTIHFIPISGFQGENLINLSDKMPWYKGPYLIEALDNLSVPEKPTNKPLRIPVQDVYKIKGAGVVPVGRVETGVIKIKQNVVVMPAEFEGEVRSIEMHHEPREMAEPGDNIGFNIRNLDIKNVRRGDVVCDTKNRVPVINPTGWFKAQVIIVWHPTALAQGYTPVVHAHTAQVACKFTELMAKLDPRSGQVVENNPQFLKVGEAAIVKLAPITKLCLETYKDIPELGRFAVRDMARTVAVGVVLSLEVGGKEEEKPAATAAEKPAAAKPAGAKPAGEKPAAEKAPAKKAAKKPAKK